MSKAEIEALLRQRVTRQGRGLSAAVWIYLAALVAILLLEGVNLHGLRANATLLTLQIAATVLTVGFLAFGVHLLAEVTVMNRADESLALTIRRRLRFLRRGYELWLWMIALAILFATFAAVTLRHNLDGRGGIERGFDLVDAGVAAAQVLLAYAILKIAHLPFMSESRALLSDLENQVTEGTRRLEAGLRSWRRWTLALALLGVAALIALALSAYGFFD